MAGDKRGPDPTPAPERFWRYVEKTESCWLWTGGLHKKGYGTFHWKQDGTTGHGAHRFSYILHYGPLELGVCVCHHCDNPRCVRPDHLFAGTALDNMRDASRKGKLPGNRSGTSGRPRISWADLLDIVESRSRGETQQSIGDRLGLTRSAVLYWERVHTAEGNGARRRFHYQEQAT